MTSSQLHRLIAEKKWDEAQQLIKDNPDTTKEPRHGDFPIHAACMIQAPDELLLEIMYKNVDAVKLVGNDGNLPLHLAIQNQLSANVIDKMIRLYPSALECKNKRNHTPRDCEHSNHSVTQLLKRPTFCWKQMMEDENREGLQSKRIESLENNVSDALEKMSKSSNHLDEMMARMENVEKKLREIESLKTLKFEDTVENLRVGVHETMLKIETRLNMVEEDVKAAAAREYISRIANRACCNDVIKIQKATVEESKMLKVEVNHLKNGLNIKTTQISA